MKILILNWRDPRHPLSGGAEISLLEHAKYWQKKGSEITWFASSFDKSPNEEVIEGIGIIRRGSHYTVHLWAFIEYMNGTFKNYTVVIDCFHFLPFFTPLYMNDKKIIALINEVAGVIWFKNLRLLLACAGYLLEPLFFLPYKNVQFITASESAKTDLYKMHIPKRNVTIIRHGISVPPKIKDPKTKNPTISFVGRVSYDKGIDDIFKTLILVKEHFSSVKLFIAGKEEKNNMIKELIKKYTLRKDDIQYFGYVSEKMKYSILQKTWILVHASIKEGWGLTVIEANSVGTPVIGYNVAGLRDSIQDKKTGLLVDPNPQALAAGIEKLLTDKNLYRKLCSNAKKWAKKFDWEKSGKESWAMIKNS